MSLSLHQILTLFGGWSVVLIGISTWSSHLLSNRLISKWRHEEKAQLQELKSSLANDKLVLESAIKSFESGQNLYQEKRLAAVELLWGGALKLRERFSSPVFFFTILAPDEYDDALTSGRPIDRKSTR